MAFTLEASMTGGDASPITTEQDLSGVTLSLNRNGIWVVTGVVLTRVVAGSDTATFNGFCNFDGVNKSLRMQLVEFNAGETLQQSLFGLWLCEVSGQPKTVKLRAAGAGTDAVITVYQTFTGIKAFWLGPSQ